MDNKVIVTLYDHTSDKATDLELDLDITALELFYGLDEAFGWGSAGGDIQNCYLAAENPIALLRGNKKLGEFGIRNGSILHYIRRQR